MALRKPFTCLCCLSGTSLPQPEPRFFSKLTPSLFLPALFSSELPLIQVSFVLPLPPSASSLVPSLPPHSISVLISKPKRYEARKVILLLFRYCANKASRCAACLPPELVSFSAAQSLRHPAVITPFSPLPLLFLHPALSPFIRRTLINYAWALYAPLLFHQVPLPLPPPLVFSLHEDSVCANVYRMVFFVCFHSVHKYKE